MTEKPGFWTEEITLTEKVTQNANETQDLVYALAASPNFDQDGVCFAARRSGLYRSEDGGRTWQDLTPYRFYPAPWYGLAVLLSLALLLPAVAPPPPEWLRRRPPPCSPSPIRTPPWSKPRR